MHRVDGESYWFGIDDLGDELVDERVGPDGQDWGDGHVDAHALLREILGHFEPGLRADGDWFEPFHDFPGERGDGDVHAGVQLGQKFGILEDHRASGEDADGFGLDALIDTVCEDLQRGARESVLFFCWLVRVGHRADYEPLAVDFVEFFGEFVGDVAADADEIAPGLFFVFHEEADVAILASELASHVWVHAQVVCPESGGLDQGAAVGGGGLHVGSSLVVGISTNFITKVVIERSVSGDCCDSRESRRSLRDKKALAS